MVEERITEKTDAQGNVIETTIERNDGVAAGVAPITVNAAPASSGGGFGLFAVVVVLALVIGAYFLFANNQSANKKDDAVAEAADNVGAAAKKVGNSVEKAVDKIDGN